MLDVHFGARTKAFPATLSTLAARSELPRCQVEAPLECGRKGGGLPISHALGDQRDRQVRLAQQLPGQGKALLGNEPGDRHTEQMLEAKGQLVAVQADLTGDPFNARRIGVLPGEQCPDCVQPVDIRL